MVVLSEISSQTLYILSKKRLARASRLEIVHRDKFGAINDPLVQSTAKFISCAVKDASSYLSHYLGRPDEADEIKRKVQERYRRRNPGYLL